MALQTNRKIFKSSLWIKIIFLSFPFLTLASLEIHFYLNAKDLLNTSNVMLIIFGTLLTIVLYHESHVEITLYPEFIVYKKGVLPRRTILKKDISSIFKKGSYTRRGPLLIVIKIKRKEEIRISPKLFLKDPYETLKKYRSDRKM